MKRTKNNVPNKKSILLMALMLLLAKSVQSQVNNNVKNSIASIKIARQLDEEYKISKFQDKVYELVTVKYLDNLFSALADCTYPNLTYSERLRRLEYFKGVTYTRNIERAYADIQNLRKEYGVSAKIADMEYDDFCDIAQELVINQKWFFKYYEILQILGKRRPVSKEALNGMLSGIRSEVLGLNVNQIENISPEKWDKIVSYLLDCASETESAKRCEKLSDFTEFMDKEIEANPEEKPGASRGFGTELSKMYLDDLIKMYKFHCNCGARQN